MNESPEFSQLPDVSGSDNTQVASSDAVRIPEVQRPPFPEPLQAAVSGLAANPRHIGGEQSARLITGITQHFSEENRELRRQLREAQESKEAMGAKCDERVGALRAVHEERCAALSQENLTLKVEQARLHERVKASEGTRHLKNFSIFVGAILLAAAVDFVKNEMIAYSIIAGLAGLGLSLFGWLSRPSRGDV